VGQERQSLRHGPSAWIGSAMVSHQVPRRRTTAGRSRGEPATAELKPTGDVLLNLAPACRARRARQAQEYRHLQAEPTSGLHTKRLLRRRQAHAHRRERIAAWSGELRRTQRGMVGRLRALATLSAMTAVMFRRAK
jgi:hypothetical protein